MKFRCLALVVDVFLFLAMATLTSAVEISRRTIERRDTAPGNRNAQSGHSDGDYVVTHHGVPHQHHLNQPTTNIDESGTGDRVPEGDRQEEIRQLVEDFISRNPDTPPIDLESLTDLTDTEVLSMLERLSTHRKRLVESDESNRWPGGYVPFVYTSSVSAYDQKEIEIAMRRMEKYTCIKFVPWVEGVTSAEYNLGHEGHLNFENGDGCYAIQGNNRLATGQKISCCRRNTCGHELFHAVGEWHAHQSPERTGWIRVNWDNIDPDQWSQYKVADPEDNILYGYDISSIMHYGTGSFNVGDRKTMTILFPELSVQDNIFYPLYEIVDSHNCKDLKCPNFPTTCENDGFVTTIDNACSCLCPYGLDKTTGCTTTITEDPTSESWPGGSYAMLTPVDGCPGSNVFSEGEVTHWSRGGSYNSNSFHLRGVFMSDSTNVHFCVMENNGNTEKWPPGDYCIHRVGGQCPEEFDEGYIQFDDETNSQSNTNSGALPDGVYNQDTRFYFCCRDDGFPDEPMELPNIDPFVLYRYDDDCQPVKGMYATEEYYYFYNYNGAGTTASSSGAHPHLYESSSLKFKTYFCYYTPYSMDCGGVIELDSGNPVATITSPNYPGAYNPSMECHWFIKAPENSTVLLNFADFEIEESGEECMDSVEIRHVRVGQPGLKYCGDGMEESIRSIFNTAFITFRSNLIINKRGFNMTASFIGPDDLCYDLADLGRSYRGKVNFTRDMKPCLPWATTNPKCPYSAVNEKYFNEGLDGNYCRNPGDGLRPWCYTGYSEKEGCLRNYCDVCLKENIYDTLDYCSELQSSDFCDEDPEAFSGCAKTCAASFPSLPTIAKASDVTCNAPSIPSDGVQVSTHHCTYKVGETVEVKCKNSNDTQIATCLTDGTWNLGNYVCGVCPTGWTPHSGYCIKFFREELNHDEATARCGEFGGILAPAHTREEFDYLISQKIFMRKIWLGADDKDTEGNWLWQDGSAVTWTHWAEGDPDNRSGEDCIFVNRENKDSTWKDTYCTSYYANFICRIDITASTTCQDRQDDCLEIFEANPAACQDYPDFARQECPYTCGQCGATNCTVPAPSSNTDVLISPPGDSMEIGEFISYACASGYTRSVGNLNRGCQRDGQLTGEAPICISVEDLVTPNNNVELISRSYVGSSKYVYTGKIPEFNITKAGEVTQWRLYSKYSGDIALQIWRPVTEDSYKFIGQNLIVTVNDAIQVVMVTQTERIQVEPGDVIGVYFGATKGGACYNYCSDSEGLVIKHDGRVSDPSTFTEGVEYSFSTSTLRCRRFSVTAMVGPRQV